MTPPLCSLSSRGFHCPYLHIGQMNYFLSLSPPHEHFKSRYTSHSSLNIQLQLLPGSVLLKAKYTPSLDTSARPWVRHGFGRCHHRAVESRAFAIRQETIAWPSLTFIFLICKWWYKKWWPRRATGRIKWGGYCMWSVYYTPGAPMKHIVNGN